MGDAKRSGSGRSGEESARTVSLPKHIDEGSAGDVDGAYAHSLEVIEMQLEAADVAPETEVNLVLVAFEDGAEEVVVSWVAICELVEKEGVERELAPVLWGSGVGLVWSRGFIVQNGGVWVWVDVDIPWDEVGLVSVGIDEREEEGKGGEEKGRKGGGHSGGRGRWLELGSSSSSSSLWWWWMVENKTVGGGRKALTDRQTDRRRADRQRDRKERYD